VVSNWIDCCDCSVYLADLTSLKDKHASTCDELDVLRVEVAELKSRHTLLGACTSCPVLHGNIDEMHAYTISLEAKLKEHVPTSCSTCELHDLKNLKLAHYVDRLQYENDESRKMIGWLSWHELSYGPPWAHYLGGYQDRLLGGPLGLPGLCHTTPDGVRHKDYGGEVLG
jgi:hypothetical protein